MASFIDRIRNQAQPTREPEFEDELDRQLAQADPNRPHQTTTPSYGDPGGYPSGPAAPAPPATPPSNPNAQPSNAPAPPPTTPPPSAPPAQPQQTFQREQFRDAWMGGSFPHTPEGLASFLRPYGLTADKAGRVKLPTGETIDMLIGANAGGQGYGWTGVAGQELKYGQAAGAPGGGGSSSTGGGSVGSSGSSGGGNGSFSSGYGGQDDAINQAIMRLLAQGEKPVTGADVDEQFAPASAAIQRGAARTKAAAAERAAFQGSSIGGAGGALDAESNAISESAGQQEGQLMAELITGELRSRRQEVADALQFAQGSQRLALQQQLAALDRELARQQMEQQNDQFGQQLSQQNNQWYDQFGQSEADREYDRSRPPTPVGV